MMPLTPAGPTGDSAVDRLIIPLDMEEETKF